MFNFTHNHTKWLLGGLILLAALFRIFYGIGNSLSYNEQLIYFFSNQESFTELLHTINKYIFNIKYHTIFISANPVVVFFIFIISKFAGASEFLLRLPALLSGVLTVPLSFFAARKFYSETEGLITSAFFTFSYFFIETSQDIFCSNLSHIFILLYIISTITFFDKIKDTGTNSILDSISVILIAVLLCISNPKSSVLVISTLFLSFFLIKKPKIFLKAFLHFFIILLLVFAYFYITNIFTLFTSKYTFSFFDLLINFNVIISNNILVTLLILFPLLFLIHIYIKKIFLPKSFGEDARTLFLNSTLFITMWLFLSTGFTYLIIYFFKIEFQPNDLFFILLPVLLLVARALVLTSENQKKQMIFISLLVLLITINTYTIQNLFFDKNPDYNSPMRYIKQKINKFPNSGIVFAGTSTINNLSSGTNNFYLKKYNLEIPEFSLDVQNKNIFDSIKSTIPDEIKYLWYIDDKSITNSYNSYINLKTEDYILQNCRVIEGTRYNNTTLMLIKL